jgi:TM2 domain-containing membrane protein YozV
LIKKGGIEMKEKELGIAYLLWFFCGLWGVHKFYLEKFGMGTLYLLTCGFFFIGWFIDLFTLPSQVDRYNLKAQAMANNNHYHYYQNQSYDRSSMDRVAMKTRRMEQRLRNIEDIVTSEEYNFHRRLYS